MSDIILKEWISGPNIITYLTKVVVVRHTTQLIGNYLVVVVSSVSVIHGCIFSTVKWSTLHRS